MYEPLLFCDISHDHEAPKDVSPIFEDYLQTFIGSVTSDYETEIVQKVSEIVEQLYSAQPNKVTQLESLNAQLLYQHQADEREREFLLQLVEKLQSNVISEHLRYCNEIVQVKEQVHQFQKHNHMQQLDLSFPKLASI